MQHNADGYLHWADTDLNAWSQVVSVTAGVMVQHKAPKRNIDAPRFCIVQAEPDSLQERCLSLQTGHVWQLISPEAKAAILTRR
jgi:hypothetical protein